jgi:hypothetical protein
MFMPKKKIGLWIEEALAAELDRLAGKYPGNKGDLLAAALHMFLSAGKTEKAAALRETLGARANELFEIADTPHPGFKAPLKKAAKPAPK